MPDQTAATRATSVLAAMAGAVTAQREAKGAKLTPVAGERPVAAGVAAAVAPALRMPDLPTEFMPQEGIEAVVRNIRAEAAKLIQIADNIDNSLGIQADTQVVIDVKAAERAADEAHAARLTAKERESVTAPAADPELASFAAAFAAQQAAAQAATFTDPKEAQRAAIRAAIAALDA